MFMVNLMAVQNEGFWHDLDNDIMWMGFGLCYGRVVGNL